jgi:hypothetical protein
MNENTRLLNLRRIVIWTSSFSGGALAATLQSFRLPVALEFSGYTVLAFVLGWGIFWAYWKIFFMEHEIRGMKLWRIATTALLIMAGLAGVLSPLRFVNHDQLPELFTGLITAAIALSGVVLLLLGSKWLFDQDEKENTAAPNQPAPDR